MRFRGVRHGGILVAFMCGFGYASAQTTPQPTSSTAEAVPAQQPSPLAGLNSEQRARFDAARRAFTGQHFAEACSGFKQLLSDLQPGSPAYVLAAEFASEAAVNTGDRTFALQTLKPIEQADADNWRAVALLARVYAENGDVPQRDAEIAHLADLHRRAATPQIAKLGQFQLERVVLPEGSMRVWYSLTPWGPYHVYVYARVYDAAEQQVLRLTLESGDFDQPAFAKEHPDSAVKGERAFSLDGYGPDRQAANGQRIQIHFSYAFYNGQPPYDTVRTAMVKAAQGNLKSLSGRSSPVAQ